jgi:methylated-DNA-[protein]-cysteine S-methyltransferase
MKRPATTYYTTIDSPLGELLLSGDGERLSRLYMRVGRGFRIAPGWLRAEQPFAAARGQLDEYFAGERTRFELELDLHGSEFQRRVWQALRKIPYGETISYGELARRIGDPGGARAVGAANGRNPVSVIVPCHRVIGADGSLTGYGGGLRNKRLLLELEAAMLRPRLAIPAAH